MGHSTYAFEDLECTVTHPSVGVQQLQGVGMGSITFAMTDDTSAHDRAADGSVMTSKIKAGNGTIAVTVQQTSEAHKWFTKAYNYVTSAPSNEWAGFAIMAVAPVMQVTHECIGVSFQKRGDKAYEANGGQITWTFMAAEMKEY